MNYYYNGSTTITCPHCDSINAKCNTDMLLTSEPPQYGCHCPDCNKNWYIYTHELRNYAPKVTLASTEITNNLEERIKTLERHIDGLDGAIMNIQKSLFELHQVLIRS